MSNTRILDLIQSFLRKIKYLCLATFSVEYKVPIFDFLLAPSPALYTVGLTATFWNLNTSVWVVLTAMGEKNSIKS